jgi:hypothetical protein
MQLDRNHLRYEVAGVTFARLLGCVSAFMLTCGCSESSLLVEAKKAEAEGRVINNEMMSALYPSSYRPGSPQYLERDFEAGADFICAEIKKKYERDICSEDKINWR